MKRFESRGGVELWDALEPRVQLSGAPFPTLGMLEDPSNTVVRVDTRYGSLDLELFDSEVSASVASFLGLLKGGEYAQTFFHRVEPGARLQGGLDRFDNDDGLSERQGLVDIDAATARDNTERTIALPLTEAARSTGELIVNLADNTPSNSSFVVIGRVIQGWDVVQQIVGLPAEDLSGFFPGSPVGANLTQVPVTESAPALVTEDLLVIITDVQIIKPAGGGFYTQRVFYPEGYSWERTYEAIDLLNPGEDEAQYQILVRYETGPRDQVVAAGALAPGARRTVVVAPGFGAASGIVRNNEPYAYEVWSSLPLAAGFRHKDFKIGVGESFFRPASLPDAAAMREWTFNQAALGFGESEAFITWQEPEGNEVQITATFYFTDAEPIEQVFTLEPHRRGGLRVREIEGLPEGAEFVGMRLTADNPIVAAITRYDQTSSGPGEGDEGGVTALGTPGGGSIEGAAPGARRGGIEPLSILNTGATDAEVTFTVIPEGGTQPIVRVVNAPAGRLLILTGDDNPAKQAGNAQFFVVRYSSAQPVTVSFISSAFRGTGTGFSTWAARETHFADARAFTAPRGAPFGQHSLSIYNGRALDTATVRIVFRFNSGPSFTSEPIVLAPGQSVHRRINEYASDIAQLQGGLGGVVRRPYSVSVLSDWPVVAQAGQLNADGRAELGMALETWSPLSEEL